MSLCCAAGNCSSDPLSPGHDMWHDLKPGTDVVPEIFYSANFYTTTAVGIIKEHAATQSAANPLFLYLPCAQIPHDSTHSSSSL